MVLLKKGKQINQPSLIEYLKQKSQANTWLFVILKEIEN